MVEAFLLLLWIICISIYSMSFLGLLICFEVFMLTVYCFSCFHACTLEKNIFSMYTLIIFLMMAVCETVIGLSLLVVSCRLGSYYSSHPFSILKF